MFVDVRGGLLKLYSGGEAQAKAASCRTQLKFVSGIESKFMSLGCESRVVRNLADGSKRNRLTEPNLHRQRY